MEGEGVLNEGRARELIARPLSAAMVLSMALGCLMLWIGLPMGWLWIGSQVQSVASLATAMAVIVFGLLVSVVLTVIVLARINQAHAALQLRRGRQPIGGSSALEVMLVSSAGVAVVLFGIWFLVFAGSSPVPLNIGF